MPETMKPPKKRREFLLKRYLSGKDPQGLSLPAFLPLGSTEVTLQGKNYVEAQGCRGLFRLEKECVGLYLKEGPLFVYGSDLSLKFYHGARIAVCGQIEGLSFGKEKCK